MNYQLVILVIFISFGIAEIISKSFLHQPEEAKGDKWVELISTVMLTVVTQPMVLLLGGVIAATIAPNSANTLAGLPILAQLGLLLVLDDMLQYWWHRASHTFPWLYGLHRAHHNGHYMSIRIVYRNNMLYYLFMPSLWITGALLYLGLGEVYVYYVTVKMSVIFGAHSNVRWDAPLYKIKALSPIMWVVERVISTPATHAAHHGRHVEDQITNYKGNFGNLLFFWDILFGTAKITRQYPETFGVENLAPMSEGAQLLWPIIRDTTKPFEENQRIEG